MLNLKQDKRQVNTSYRMYPIRQYYKEKFSAQVCVAVFEVSKVCLLNNTMALFVHKMLY